VSKLAEKKYKVQILSRTEVVVYPKLNQPKPLVLVTYYYPPLPPATIQIPKAEYSKEKEAELIRKDIERRLKATVEEVEV